MFDVESGSIRIDGQDVRARDAGKRPRRHRPGQPGHVAAAPLGAREYLKYGRQTATDEEMIRAAEQAKVA
jgi:ATP-binding cassette subfamily B multidrug efflux pump